MNVLLATTSCMNTSEVDIEAISLKLEIELEESFKVFIVTRPCENSKFICVSHH